MTDAPPLLVLVGPTAAGKSAAAMAACEALGGEIVSADSGQVYRGLDIGSAKPTAAERARIRHHGIDLAAPEEQVDAATWCDAADRAIADVRERGRIPLVCGGTGLYVRVLLHGLSPIPPVDAGVRAAVREELAARGPLALHAELAAVDPEVAARVAPTDPQRIGRALEVWRQTGKALGQWQREHAFRPRRYQARVFGLWPEREVLHRRIEERVGVMLRAGWVAEVERLLAAGVPPDAPGLRTLGYRDIVTHLAGGLSAGELPARIATQHRRYARRQLTWFRGVTTREDQLERLDPADAVGALIGAVTRASRRC